MITIIDTGGANLASVTNAINRLNKQWEVTSDPEKLTKASHVILPGVGTAKKNWERVNRLELADGIKRLSQPVLGICVGMQLLFEASEEGMTDCLGLIPGIVTRFPSTLNLPVPHMGWNQVFYTDQPDQPILDHIPSGSYFYFVHSFRGPTGDHTIAYSSYGKSFPAIVNVRNFYGTQFHPEKSSRLGSKLLENFCNL